MRAYIDAHSQRIIDECPKDGTQDFSIFQSQCAHTTFADESRYNRKLHQMLHKVGESEINSIKIFRNDKALENSVRNSYTADQLVSTFLEN